MKNFCQKYEESQETFKNLKAEFSYLLFSLKSHEKQVGSNFFIAFITKFSFLRKESRTFIKHGLSLSSPLQIYTSLLILMKLGMNFIPLGTTQKWYF